MVTEHALIIGIKETAPMSSVCTYSPRIISIKAHTEMNSSVNNRSHPLVGLSKIRGCSATRQLESSCSYWQSYFHMSSQGFGLFHHNLILSMTG